LVPDQSAAPDRSRSGLSTARVGSPSEPPTSTSQFSNSRTGTPRPQTLDPNQAAKAGFLPLFAALGGVAAAASAIFWVTHRPAPMPLITTTLPDGSQRVLAKAAQRRTDSASPVGVNIDSLPTSGGTPSTPDADAMNALLTGHKAAVVAVATGASPASSPRVEKTPNKDSKDPAAPVNANKVKELSVNEDPPAVVAPPSVAPPSALPPPDQRAPLSRGAAMSALSTAASAAAGCKRPDGPTGSGSASVTFSPDGPAKSVSVSAPFAGTPVGQCIATVFRGAHVPPFSGSSITLPKSFQIPQ
jgi:hypothetical protein